MIEKIQVKVDGVGTVGIAPRWFCVKCGRDFKLPKVPGSCETLYSICMTCFAISCTEDLGKETLDT